LLQVFLIYVHFNNPDDIRSRLLSEHSSSRTVRFYFHPILKMFKLNGEKYFFFDNSFFWLKFIYSLHSFFLPVKFLQINLCFAFKYLF
jgi:hypothetical protein